jgi:anaerobic selenocysteine-containing dehydrogenase
LIVVWGCNPQVSGIHLLPPIRAARAGGARLVVIDPRSTPLARQADLHLAPRPGTDVAVALALLRELFESGRADLDFLAARSRGWEELRRRAAAWTTERAAVVAGVPPADLLRLAQLWADSSPAVIRCGWGQERNRNGGAATMAILALPAVAGKFGVRGGGYTMSNSGAWGFDAGDLAGPEPPTRIVNMNRLGDALNRADDPPVRLLFVYDSNALATTPNQSLVRRGLEREDLFTVVFDAVATDTVRYADIVLPATTFLEHRELSRGYGAYAMHVSDPVIDRVGESRPNYEVFAELARRTGVARDEEIPDEAEAVRRLIDSTGHGEALRGHLERAGWAPAPSGERPVQFVDVFPRTADGRIDLVPEDLDREAPEGLYAYRPDPGTSEHPLALISPASGRTVSSTFGQLRSETVPLEIHARDAAERGIASGDRVRVSNGWGEVVCRALVSDSVRPGVVSLPKGLWSHHTENGATANSLVPDSLTDVAGGACFNDARVEVRKV